jgi:GT2 family glycosyltransferase
MNLRNVSVIIPTIGDSPSLRRCLDSLAKQECDLPVEVIVVLNGPRSQAVDCQLPGVMIVHEPKAGPAAARNKGIRESSGDCVAFIDDDCTAAPHWLSAALGRMRREGADKIVAGAITRSGARSNWVSFFDSVNYLQQENYVRYSGACVTANLIMHRSTFERVGPFDETFHEAACEDWEWAGRARRQSIPILFDASAAVDHPCMWRLRQLKRKAQRLGRGELTLKAKSNPEASPPPLLSVVAGQIKRAKAPRDLRLGDRMALYWLGVFVAFWMWDAARRMQAVRTSHDL